MSNKPMQSHAENKPTRKTSAYEEFILWTAMPPTERLKLGMEDQAEFAKVNQVNPTTLSRWKAMPDFQARVTDLRKKWAFDKTSDVIYGIYRAAVKGNPLSQKLWLQYFHGFAERTETQHTHTVEVGVNDVRFIIDGLPEPARSKFHGYIREIVEYANAVKSARVVDPSVWDANAPQPLPDAPDNDAQNVPGERANEVAHRHTPGVRCDMVGDPLAHHNKGAPRWG